MFFRSLAKAKELRKVVHDAVLSDPDTFSEAALGKPPKEYAEWVLRPNSWGGQVELFVLSTHLRKQIAAYDVQTGRVDVYGEDRFPRSERGHLIYDGLHYDALVFAYPGLEDVSDTHVTVVDCSLEPNLKNKRIRPKSSRVGKKRPGAKTVHRCRQFFAQVFSLSNRPRRRKRSQRTRQEHRAYELWRVLRKIRRIPLAEKRSLNNNNNNNNILLHKTHLLRSTRKKERKNLRENSLSRPSKSALIVLHRVYKHARVNARQTKLTLSSSHSFMESARGIRGVKILQIFPPFCKFWAKIQKNSSSQFYSSCCV